LFAASAITNRKYKSVKEMKRKRGTEVYKSSGDNCGKTAVNSGFTKKNLT